MSHMPNNRIYVALGAPRAFVEKAWAWQAAQVMSDVRWLNSATWHATLVPPCETGDNLV